ncbi:hypothetical protein CKALI_11000 [Corynebacterium kalinowskii]|uniref:Uncharacterized protein n=1 Tax=Corynebacterium kalinowskii TaxID=2675216 RepID=A0A6B8VJ36_9CORY|nr:hypothetical protein [Corynebacterium kalinowskii]QGU03049.1 hypothetical protein CKALI_11000 [Corynebacterium kalinowskii]
MRKITAAAFSALVLSQTVIPGVAQTITTTPVVSPAPFIAEETVEGYDKYLPTIETIPTPEPALVTETATPTAKSTSTTTATATATPTTTPAVPKDFLNTDKVSYVFKERTDKEVNELTVGEEFAVQLKFDMEKFKTGEVMHLGTEGMAFKDMDLPQMMMANNLGFPIATFEDISKDTGAPMLRVQKIDTREEITPDFGWEAQIILPVEVSADFEAKAIEKNEPIVPLIGVVEETDKHELQLVKPAEAQDRPQPKMEAPAEIAAEETPAVETVKPAPVDFTEEVQLIEPLAAPAPEMVVEDAEKQAVETKASGTPTTTEAAKKDELLADAMGIVNAVEKVSGDIAKVSGGEEKFISSKASPVPYAAPAEQRSPETSASAPVNQAAPQATPVAPVGATAQAPKSRPMLAMTGASVLGVLLVATVLFIIGSTFLARPKGRHS